MPRKDKEKGKEYYKQYYLDNKEYFKQYTLDNKEKKKKWNKQYYSDNREKNKQYYLDNREKILKQSKQYQLDNIEKLRERQKQYRLVNREKKKKYDRQYEKNKMKTDPIFKFIKYQRSRIRSALKRKRKSKSTIGLLGCSAERCWNHLEQQFKPGMTRDNYGLWHIDHILPCAYFDLSDPKQQEKCFHYTNLQPLWAIDNIKKGAKLDYETQ